MEIRIQGKIAATANVSMTNQKTRIFFGWKG